jgi:hypothetical protein
MQLAINDKHDASWVINEKRSDELKVSILPPQQVRALKKKKN